MSILRTEQPPFCCILIVTCITICKELATSDDFYVLQINFDGWGCVSKNRPFKCVGLKSKKCQSYNHESINILIYLYLHVCYCTIFTLLATLCLAPKKFFYFNTLFSYKQEYIIWKKTLFCKKIVNIECTEWLCSILDIKVISENSIVP